VAVIAAVGSAVASLVTSSLLLTPALLFIRRANSRHRPEPDEGSVNEADEEVDIVPVD